MELNDKAGKTIESLPSEILLEILGHLEYFDLKIAIPRLNKKFRELITNKSLQAQIAPKLFRDVPCEGMLYKGSFTLHPMLMRPSFTNTFRHRVTIPNLMLLDHEPIKFFRNEIEELLGDCYRTWTFDGNRPSVKFKEFMHENVVSPASAKVVLKPRIFWGARRVSSPYSCKFLRYPRVPIGEPIKIAEISRTVIYLALRNFTVGCFDMYNYLTRADGNNRPRQPPPSLSLTSLVDLTFEVEYSIGELETINGIPSLGVNITLHYL